MSIFFTKLFLIFPAGSSRSGGTDAGDPWSLKKCFMKRPPYLFGLGLTFRKPGRFPFYGMPNTTKLTNEGMY